MNIAFGESAGSLLRFYGNSQENFNVLCFLEDLSFGPLNDVKNRSALASDYLGLSKEQHISNLHQMEDLKEATTIWYSDSPFEYCGMLYLNQLLHNNGVDVHLAKLPDSLKQEGACCIGELDFRSLGCITPIKSVEKTCSNYCEQWKTLVDENGYLRVFTDGTIKTTDWDFFDAMIIPRLKEGHSIENICVDVIVELREKHKITYNMAIITRRIEELILAQK